MRGGMGGGMGGMGGMVRGFSDDFRGKNGQIKEKINV